MKKIFYLFKATIICLLLLLKPAHGGAMDKTDALRESDFYFLVDADTKEILLSRNADVKISPSSMTKVMTAYVVFDQIRSGVINLNNQCLIGKDAWRKSGSSMFLNYGDVVTIDELLQGLLAVSGNDASIALAEAVGGGYENFVQLMNVKAKEIGLKNSHFKNPHGLNENNHYMSLRDLANLTIRIYEEFPQYSHYLNIKKFTYGNITQFNRNPLLRTKYDGVIGGKTGHTDDGGYGVVGIVKRDHRRLIGVVNKARTPNQRTKTITQLLDYGFSHYKKLVLFEKGQEVVKLPIWLGAKDEVVVSANHQIAFNILRSQSLDDVKVRVVFKGPIQAPIVKGAKIANLIVEIKGYKNFEYSLFAQDRIDKIGILEKISIISRYKLRNFINKIF